MIDRNDDQTSARDVAIVYLKKLKPTEAAFEHFLVQFKSPKAITLENIILGVKAFLKIATLSPEERVHFYGNSLLGIHDNHSLVQAWHKTGAIKIDPTDFDSFVTGEWHKINERPYMALVYDGHNPAQALDHLLAGPTVLDCGMFCQLGIWFGFRYVLGDEQFNEIMALSPLYITQFNYQKNTQTPHLGNPLFRFFTITSESRNPMLQLNCVFNINDYKFKHPAGHYKQHNCIVIDGLYYIQEENKGLTRSELEDFLLKAYNNNPDDQDRAFIDEAFHDSDLLEDIDPNKDWDWDNFASEHDALTYSTYTKEEFLQQSRRSSEDHFGGVFTLDLQKVHLFYKYYKEKKHRTEHPHSTPFHGMNPFVLMPMHAAEVSSPKKRPREGRVEETPQCSF